MVNRYIEFDPKLPYAKRQLFERLPLGNSVKAQLVYPEGPFWRAAGWSGTIMYDYPLHTPPYTTAQATRSTCPTRYTPTRPLKFTPLVSLTSYPTPYYPITPAYTSIAYPTREPQVKRAFLQCRIGALAK